MKKTHLWDPLGVVLGNFLAVSGSILGGQIIKIHWFLKGFVKIHIFNADTD